MITASRLGTSPIVFDWTRLPGGPARESSMDIAGAWSALKARFASGEIGFYDSPINAEISQIEAAVELGTRLSKSEGFRDCLFLGIGGSSLGPLSFLGALADKCSRQIKFHFLENPDPIEWKSTLGRLSPDTTLVVCVTKSGTTFETLAQWLCALEWLGKARWNSHTIAITDPEKGDLRAFARNEAIPTLTIAPNLGGRFSLFSPVGTFAATLAGLDAKEFLAGAKTVRDACEKLAPEKNPLMIIAAELIAQYPKRSTHVCMPYSTRLRTFGDWFVQLWGESLGKDGKGFTPIAALGAVDQHSILQLLRDGPDDKVTMFIAVDSVDDAVKIPKAPIGPDRRPYAAFQILEGHTLHELLTVEQRAIERVLSNQKRPSLTAHLEKLDERNLGALYFASSVLVSITGTLWGVNPFDQPGVEEGKVYIRESLQKIRDAAADA